jgi:hypothetical protein
MDLCYNPLGGAVRVWLRRRSSASRGGGARATACVSHPRPPAIYQRRELDIGTEMIGERTGSEQKHNCTLLGPVSWIGCGQPGPAPRPWPPEAGYNGAPPLVWVLGPTESGRVELVFEHHLGVGLAAQLPPTTEAGWCLAPSQAAQAPGYIMVSHTQDQNQQFITHFHI